MANNIDDGLTEEERAALESDDDVIDGAVSGDAEEEDVQTGGDDGDNEEDVAEEPDEDKEDEDDGADTGVDDGDAGRGDGAAADDEAISVEEDGAATTQQEKWVHEGGSPLLVAEAPTDADAKLSEISDKKATLIEQFDDGDITAKEYQKQLDVLMREERKIELLIHEAELAKKMEAQRQANEWKSTVDGFIADNARYNPQTSPRMYQMLDIEVRAVAQSDEFKDRTDMASGRAILQRAHENLAKEFGYESGKAAEAKPAGKAAAKPAPKPDATPSLHNTPAADANDVTGGKFAVLDRLASTDPIAYEERLMRLSESERESYLSA